MAKIRQEINLLSSLASATSGNALFASELSQLDTTQYNGTVTYYFEIVAYSSSSLAFGVQLYATSGGTQVTINVPTSTTTPTLFRSASFTPTSSRDDLQVYIDNTVGATKFVKSARVIVIQNATTLTNTETQIEIGNASSTTATTDTALTNPKYWQYTSANWDGTLTVYFEGTFITGTSKSAATMTLQTSTSITAPSWSNVASSAVTTTQTAPPIRVRSGAITLTAGNWYRAVMKAGNSKSGITVYNAKIIIDQQGGSDKSTSTNSNGGFIFGGTSGGTEAAGQSFTTTSAYTLDIASLKLYKSGSPTDNLSLAIYSGSITGSLVATSDNVAASSLVASPGSWINFNFSTPPSLSSSTKYYLRLTRSGARDLSNYVVWDGSNASSYANGGAYTKDTDIWSSESSTNDDAFAVFGTGITKLEPQYLLANTLLGAGTSLQTFLTKWDSTEWDASSGTITYYFQGEAADNSTSDMTLEQADGGGTVTNSTLTNIDNAQISSAMTMPASENLDVIANANAGDVAAARILVYYVYTAAPAEAEYEPSTNSNARTIRHR